MRALISYGHSGPQTPVVSRHTYPALAALGCTATFVSPDLGARLRACGAPALPF